MQRAHSPAAAAEHGARRATGHAVAPAKVAVRSRAAVGGLQTGNTVLSMQGCTGASALARRRMTAARLAALPPCSHCLLAHTTHWPPSPTALSAAPSLAQSVHIRDCAVANCSQLQPMADQLREIASTADFDAATSSGKVGAATRSQGRGSSSSNTLHARRPPGARCSSSAPGRARTPYLAGRGLLLGLLERAMQAHAPGAGRAGAAARRRRGFPAGKCTRRRMAARWRAPEAGTAAAAAASALPGGCRRHVKRSPTLPTLACTRRCSRHRLKLRRWMT